MVISSTLMSVFNRNKLYRTRQTSYPLQCFFYKFIEKYYFKITGVGKWLKILGSVNNFCENIIRNYPYIYMYHLMFQIVTIYFVN